MTSIKKTKIAEFPVYGREPILRRMADGGLVCLFLTGGESETRNDNYVAIAKGQDGKRFEIVAKLELDEANFFYPHAYADEGKRVLYAAYENETVHYLARNDFEELGIGV